MKQASDRQVRQTGRQVGFWVSVGRVWAWGIWFRGSGGQFRVWAGLGAQILGLDGWVVG